MGRRLNRTLVMAIEQSGENYFERLRDGWTTSDFHDFANSNGFHKCDCCRSWEEQETSGGNGEASLCTKCFYTSTKRIAIEAREIYRKLGTNIDEPTV